MRIVFLRKEFEQILEENTEKEKQCDGDEHEPEEEEEHQHYITI